MITTKQEMMVALNHVLNNFMFGLVVSRVTPEGGWQRFASEKARFEGPDSTVFDVDLAPLIANLSRPSNRKILVEEFENMLKRALLSEGHEIIMAYCEATNQFALDKAEPWFQFARILRNVTSHKDGGVLHAWPADLQKAGTVTVSWCGRALDSTMVGKAVAFTHHEALQLFNDQMDFANTKLA